ncbi:MAG: heparinase II/III family protein [Pseudomonadota bacterium]
MNEALGLWQRAALLRAGLARPSNTFVSFPEPRPRGLAARGIQYTSGNFIIDGEVVEAPDQSIWDVGQTSKSHRTAALSFEWVDDLVATGSKTSLNLMRDWFAGWQGQSDQPLSDVWDPYLVAHRLIRLLNHGTVFLQGLNGDQQRPYFATVTKQFRYLSYTWRQTDEGLPRITALVSLIFAAHATEATTPEIERYVTALGEACADLISEDGGIASRNPEELMQVFSLLSWTSRVVEALELPQNKQILKALERVAPALRALRFANGNLAVFQGGGAGMLGRLDQALADGRVRIPAHPEGAMGYQRMSASRSMLLVDAGPSVSLPSLGALEFAVGRHQVFANSGASNSFGEEWAEKGRRSIAHSMVVMNRADTSLNAEPPTVTRQDTPNGETLILQHNGYRSSYGLTVERTLTLSHDGRSLGGEDRIFVADAQARKTFDSVARGAAKLRVPISIHFHLAMETDAEINLGGTILSIKLANDQVWGFRQAGGKLTLKPSVLMTPNRLRPLPSQQIQITGDVSGDGLKIGWLLERLS